MEAWDYTAFRKAAENGHLDVLRYLGEKAPDLLKDMIEADVYQAFISAASNGHLDVLRYLDEKAPDLLGDMIEADNYDAFQLAANHGHLAILHYLVEKAGEQLQAMITSENYAAFQYAASAGHLDVLYFLEKFIPENELPNMISCTDYLVYRKTASAGHLEVLQYLETKAPNQLQAMIAANIYAAFQNAASEGHLAVLRYLRVKAPEQLQYMIADDNYAAFQNAAGEGHLKVLHYLVAKAPNQLQAMIAADNYAAFQNAASEGHLKVLRYLVAKAPEQLQHMIAAENYAAFLNAASNGHLKVLHYLEAKAPNQLQAMIVADNYAAFQYAASNGHLDVLCYLESQASEQLSAMIAGNDYAAFRGAAKNGRLEVLRYLEENAPERLGDMIAADNYAAFRNAASEGHLAVLRHLEAKAPNQRQAMHASDDYSAFRMSWNNGKFFAAYHSLNQAPVFAYAEQHVREYSEPVQAVISEKMWNLRSYKSVHQRISPNTVFDIAQNYAEFFFYVMRHLIRRNNPNRRDDLILLLEIPAVKNLVHQDNNQLLRLALSLNNRMASQLLLSIPAVRQLAEANHYYRAEMQGGLDLAALARDHESSMTALTPGEQARLSGVQAKYGDLLKRTGVENCMMDLRNTLQELYSESPASITINTQEQGNILELPLTWNAFQALPLTQNLYQNALEAYHQNIYHTAWRFLEKPNPWMHPNASYVNVNPRNPSQRWAMFEPYQELICLLYLAVMDELTEATEGFTKKLRLEHFLKELALINRAHNWDESRPKTDKEGRVILKRGRVEEEQFDNIKYGDRPGCFSGNKRRLSVSVQGHPLFAFLTEEKIRAELAEFVRGQFSTSIIDDNRTSLKEAWDKTIEAEPLTEHETALINNLDISKALQESFIQKLSEKYGKQFHDDPSFVRLIEDAFDRKPHLVSFAYLGIEELLAPARETALPLTVVIHRNENSFFRPLDSERGSSEEKASHHP